MRDRMTSKERWLAAIRMKPVDRLPFWPKLDGAYPRAQEPLFRDMNLDALHEWIGSDRHTWISDCTREVRKKTSTRTTVDGGTMRTVYCTPHGELQLVLRFDEPSNSWHPVDFPVKTPEAVRLMTEMFADLSVELDRGALDAACAQSRQIGQSALTACGIGESPLMNWVEWLAGVENAHLLLADSRRDVEALFESMHRVLLQKTRLLCEHSPADVLYLIENTSTTLISPEQYRRYCARHVGEYASLTKGADRNLVLHMCGHVKALLPDLARIPAQAFEAFTSPTLGNTSLLDGRSACPDTCLIGGTNAMLWTTSARVITARIEQDLAELPHHRGIVLTSAGVMPPMCKPDTIKRVCEWVKQYPARMGETVPSGARGPHLRQGEKRT
jgi:uroporphyrinogen-III decarboxylase